jgi:5-methylcytosine-specific restriction endonuclease McrA
MSRQHNTSRHGNEWTLEQIKVVWSKGRVIDNYNPEIWRRDLCGYVMEFSEHGNRNSEYGWEIDHINPVVNGGGDELTNLQPLCWENNAKKSDQLDWNCK